MKGRQISSTGINTSTARSRWILLLLSALTPSPPTIVGTDNRGEMTFPKVIVLLFDTVYCRNGLYEYHTFVLLWCVEWRTDQDYKVSPQGVCVCVCGISYHIISMMLCYAGRMIHNSSAAAAAVPDPQNANDTRRYSIYKLDRSGRGAPQLQRRSANVIFVHIP